MPAWPPSPLPLPPCRQAIAQLLRAETWADAVSMLLRFAASCDGAGARNSQCKAYLGAGVVWLYAGKANDAWITYQVSAHGVGSGARECVSQQAWLVHSVPPLRQGKLSRASAGKPPPTLRRTPAPLPHSRSTPASQDALAVDTFTSSDEAFAADALFDAYRRYVLCSAELRSEEKCGVPCAPCMIVAVVCAVPKHAVGWPAELEQPPVLCWHLACSGEAAAIQGTIKHSPVFTNLDNQASRLLALAASRGPCAHTSLLGA